MAKVKYPLTEEAKETAKKLVEWWNRNKSERIIQILAHEDYDKFINVIGEQHFAELEAIFDGLSIGVIYELIEYKLIKIAQTIEDSLQILLLQELRNAVENDFEVSDYFLTLNAVGTIVYGNLEVKEGAKFQSVGHNEGVIIQNVEQLVTEVEKLLGSDILEKHPDLATALQSARSGDEKQQKYYFGKVVAELGRLMEKLDHFQGAIGAIAILAKFFM